MSAPTSTPTISTSLTTTDASSPFDPNAKSDVILRSVDLVDFHVLRYLLTLASPVFDSLFTDASPDVVKNEKPVVPMQEHSTILSPLLQLCYPGSPPTFNDIDTLLQVISASEKFCIESDAFAGSLRHAVVISPVMQSKPERLFAIGIRHRWRDVCEAAGTRSIVLEAAHSNALHRRIFGDELSYISGADLYVLMSYHREVADVALRITRDIDADGQSIIPGSGSPLTPFHAAVAEFPYPSTMWLPNTDVPFPKSFFKEHSSGCQSLQLTRKIWVFDPMHPGDHVFTMDVPVWWFEYVKDVGMSFRDRPSRETILDAQLFQKAVDRATHENSKCTKCRDDASIIIRKLHDWTHVFARLVEGATKEVKLKINFD